MRMIFSILTLVVIASIECKAVNQVDELKLIETYFNAAVAAEGDDYFELREKVLQYGEEAIPVLRKSSIGDRPQARVIARALLAWLEQPDSKLVRSGAMKALNEVLNSAAHDGYLISGMNALSDKDISNIQASFSRLHVYDKIGFDVTSVLMCRGGFEWTIMQQVPRRIQAMQTNGVFLLEVSLKGFPPQWREQVGRARSPDYVNQLARGYAAALAGGLSCQDTTYILSDLLKTEESWVVRFGAAHGLKLFGDKTVAITHLIQALRNDASYDVRYFAFLSLRELTGDRLTARERIHYSMKIEPHHIAAAEKWWAENKERVQREPVQRQSRPEKVEVLSSEELARLIREAEERKAQREPVRQPTQEDIERFQEQKEALFRQIKEEQKKSGEPVDSAKDSAVDSD